jgi:hypothetical protein
MTARGFDYYDQMTAAVRPSPAPQAPTATAAPQATKATATRGSDRLLRAGALLLAFAGIMFLAALIVTVTPLGRIDADITVPFVAAVLGGLGVIAWAVLR